MNTATLHRLVVTGVGTVTNPPLTDAELGEIRARAVACTDSSIYAQDLARLIEHIDAPGSTYFEIDALLIRQRAELHRAATGDGQHVTDVFRLLGEIERLRENP